MMAYLILSMCNLKVLFHISSKLDVGTVARTDLAGVCGASRLFAFGFWHWTFRSLVGIGVERLGRQCGSLGGFGIAILASRSPPPPTRAKPLTRLSSLYFSRV